METLVPPALAASAPERARAVQALLDAHGPEMDRRRELTPEVVDALAGQDLLRMLLPKSMGGQETPLVEYCKACEAIAWADASSGLVRQPVQRLGRDVRRLHAARGGGRHVRRPARGPCLGRPAQQQHRRPGGGRLPADRHLELRQRRPPHQMAGRPQRRAESDGTPHMRYGRPDDRSFLFLREQATIIDDWHVLGLRGTGSDSYSVKDLFVPDAHAPARDVPDERREKGPIYPIGSTLLYASGFCSVTLGLGRRMLETYTELARGKHSRAAPTVMARNNSVQREIGLLEAKLSAARAFLHEAAGQVYDASAAGTLDVDLRLRLRLATTYGMNEATDVSIACYRGAGTDGDLGEGALRAPLPRRA